MNKEQAIEIIETHSDDISSSSLLGQALNMAIDALKAQLPNEGTTKDAISRQVAIDALDVGAEFLRRVLDVTDLVGVERTKYEWGIGLIEACIGDIKELPPAQPEPKEGHWILHETSDGGEQYECSECGVLWEFNDGTPEDNEAFYCPKCGVKMKGEQDGH